MKILKFASWMLALAVFSIMACQDDSYEITEDNTAYELQEQNSHNEELVLTALNKNPKLDKKKGGNGGGNGGGGNSCPSSVFDIAITGDATGSVNNISNCTSDAEDRIIISTSSGPNPDMQVNLSGLTTDPGNCFNGEETGPMVINADGTVSFYFKQGKNKYVWNASGPAPGVFPPDVGNSIIITLTSYTIKKDGKTDPNCLINSASPMSATITIIGIS